MKIRKIITALITIATLSACAASAYAKPIAGSTIDKPIAEVYVPWECGESHPVNQGINDDISHTGPYNAFSWDIGMPIGTPLLAAADGIITQVIDTNTETRTSCDKNNKVYMHIGELSDADMQKLMDNAGEPYPNKYDGYYILYEHINPKSARVKVGDRVKRGDVIAESGEIGCASGPHLHFGVWKKSPNSANVSSIWRGLGIPQSGESITSNNCATTICTPSPEVCDGRDNDCDTLIDEGLDETSCPAMVCTPSTETCDGSDNDCDYYVDEVSDCECVASPEVCDGKDNDCDGAVDEDDVCKKQPDCTPSEEICDDKDNDCDGEIDEGNVCKKPDNCTPSEEICDQKDNDCDGKTDEGDVCNPLDANGSEDYEFAYHAMTHTSQNTDIDGDGKAEVCMRTPDGLSCVFSADGITSTPALLAPLSDDNGMNKTATFASLRMADINGDGKADVCIKKDNGISCWLSDGKSLGNEIVTGILSGTQYNNPEYYSTFQMPDINGDGKADICVRDAANLLCYPSTGTSFDKAVTVTSMSDSSGWNLEKYVATVIFADISGDKKADACMRGKFETACNLSNGTSFDPDDKVVVITKDWSDENGYSERSHYLTIRAADINGDAKADICIRGKEGIDCRLSSGTTFTKVTGPNWSNEAGWNAYPYYATIQYADINGDGKDDVCGRGKDGFHCVMSNGIGFDKEYSIPEFSDANGWNKAPYFNTIRIGDLNGDGRMDVCGRGPAGDKCYIFNDSQFVAANTPVWFDATYTAPSYYATYRFDGPDNAPCSTRSEICDGRDNNCNGEIDENLDCKDEPIVSPNQPDNPEVPEEIPGNSTPHNPPSNDNPPSDAHPSDVGNNSITSTSADGCSSFPSEQSGTPTWPMAFFATFGLFGLAALRRKRVM